jgi:hypothetical protein
LHHQHERVQLQRDDRINGISFLNSDAGDPDGCG